jgi:hypothetical protein
MVDLFAEVFREATDFTDVGARHKRCGSRLKIPGYKTTQRGKGGNIERRTSTKNRFKSCVFALLNNI